MRLSALAVAAAWSLAAGWSLPVGPALAAGGPSATTDPASGLTTTSATLNATVDPDGAIVASGSCAFLLGTSTGYGETVPCTITGSGTQTVSAQVTDLSPGTSYDYEVEYAVLGAGASGPSEIDGGNTSFSTLTAMSKGSPTATTRAPDPVFYDGAALRGSVDPARKAVKACTFTLTSAGASAETLRCAQKPRKLTGSRTVAVDAPAGGLQPDTTYGVQLSLTTSQGTVIADEVTFTTPVAPLASTSPATDLAATTATLSGVVDPEGEQVIACAFEYAVVRFSGTPTPAFVRTVRCSPKPSGDGEVTVSGDVAHLAPRYRYFDRVVLATSGGYAFGATRTFVTGAVTAQSRRRDGRPAADRTRSRRRDRP